MLNAEQRIRHSESTQVQFGQCLKAAPSKLLRKLPDVTIIAISEGGVKKIHEITNPYEQTTYESKKAGEMT